MLSMDGTNGSTTFTDSSLNALTVTATGNAQISTTQSKFGGASAYFDGTGDYLDIPYGEPFNLTTDYTIEFWMRSDSVTGYAPIFTLTSATLSYFGGIYVVRNGSTITFETRPADGSGSAVTAITGGSISANIWYHVAASVSSNSARLFINGVQVGSTTTFTSRTFTPTGARVGRFANNYTSGLVDFQGYIDDLRISKFARYTSTFTPPTAALPTNQSSTVADPYYNYTSLLLHMDGANNSTSFVDSGPNALTLTTYGTAAVSTTQSKYGGASAYFDGSGARIGLSSTAIDFGTGDFTAECWIYLNASPSSANAHIMGKHVYGTGASWILQINTSRVLSFLWNDGANVLSTGTALNLSQWYHIAACRSGSTLRVFINGTQVATTTISYTFSSATEFTVCSASNNNALSRVNAYIDDLRITKYARFTSAFTPPTAAFPNA
jgi:hypothetical protein